MKEYEVVVGLEVHVELSTKTKIFCGCTTEFGGLPNTHICPVCLGLPGALPTLNERVVDYAVMTGLALDCEINRYNKFDRKNYFYPDLPKAYQISQLYIPICQKGKIDIFADGNKKTIGIHEIHMEEDAGKLIHSEDNTTLIDYNRCGVPLLEIVSEPDFSSASEVVAYLTKLRETLMYLGVSDCKMQEGSMRADINLSVRPKGDKNLGTRTEMKNMSSFKAIEKAIEYEAKRQIELIEKGEKVVQQTRRWDEEKEISFSMRTKEDASDYRYFPEPDLLPVEISEERIDYLKNTLPELAEDKRKRYVSDLSLTEYEAEVLTSSVALSKLFEDTLEYCKSSKQVCNIILGEYMRLLKLKAVTAEDKYIDPKKIACIIELTLSNKINNNTAKEVFEEVFEKDIDPNIYIEEKGLAVVTDEAVVSKAIDEVLRVNPKSVEDYLSGKQKARGFIVGQTMKLLKGKADPKILNTLIDEKLSKL